MRALRLPLAVAASAAAAASLAAVTPKGSALWPRFVFPPDLAWLVERTDGATLAGPAIAGACVALFAARRGVRLAAIALAVLNPLALYAFALGSSPSLAFAAIVIVSGAIAALATDRDHSAVVMLGIALAAGAALSNTALVIAPIVLMAAPVLSPWGFDGRRLAGFVTAVFAPLAMAILAALYLYWLIGSPKEAVAVSASAPLWRDLLLVSAGAALAGSAEGSHGAQLAAFAAAAVVLAMARPDLLARAAGLVH